ncbi:type II secretion system protein M [Sulfuriferula thiophila]|uniref:type II secretion system protein M n=1 Tax=Sulfuriferula thiophila TaxID=1781211 RepID=UPI000F6121C6|nr:type II secretion system protein M [Sulfuriferula thiophila]
MKTQLRKAWESRAPRERTFIVILSIIISATLYLWLIQSGGKAHQRLRASVTTLRAQASQLEQQSIELGQLRAVPTPPASHTDLRTLVQAQTDAAGLTHALIKMDAPDADHVQVVFNAVAFSDWLNWVTSLKAQQIRLDTSQIEALPAPGMVSVTATLQRAQH